MAGPPPGVPPGAVASLLAQPEPDRAAVEVSQEEGLHPLASDVRGHAGGRVGSPRSPGRVPRRTEHAHDREVPTPPQGQSGGITAKRLLDWRNYSFTDAIPGPNPARRTKCPTLNVSTCVTACTWQTATKRASWTCLPITPSAATRAFH